MSSTYKTVYDSECVSFWNDRFGISDVYGIQRYASIGAKLQPVKSGQDIVELDWWHIMAFTVWDRQTFLNIVDPAFPFRCKVRYFYVVTQLLGYDSLLELINNLKSICSEDYVQVLRNSANKFSLQSLTGAGYTTYSSSGSGVAEGEFYMIYDRLPTQQELLQAFGSTGVQDSTSKIVITQPESVLETESTLQVIKESQIPVSHVDLGSNVVAVTPELKYIVDTVDTELQVEHPNQYPIYESDKRGTNTTSEIKPDAPTGLGIDLTSTQFYGIPNWVWIIVVIGVGILVFKVAKR